MKRKQMQFISVIMAVVFLGVGCGKKADSQDKENNAETALGYTTKQQAEPEEYVFCFDAQAAAASLKINGEAISFPIDVSKLKQNIKFNSLAQTVSSHYYRGGLLDEESEIGMVEVFSESGSPKEDAYIYSLEVKEGSHWNLEINGVTFGAAIDQTIAAIGEPIYRNGEENGNYRIYYENCQYEFLAFAFEQGALKTISFSYLPEEWRNR